jgi:DnaK suppressor protein
MWMTREQISEALGIVPNSVRGKVLKGQIERRVEGGKNYYRVVDQTALKRAESKTKVKVEEEPARAVKVVEEAPTPKPPARPAGAFNPRQVLLEQLASMKVERSIDAIEKGDEIDLATGEISRELDARISMRQHRQIKEIEEALERIKHGEYGICEECGEPIPEQRLRLFPAAKLCVRCQEEYDQYEKFREDQSLRGGHWREDASESGYARAFEE